MDRIWLTLLMVCALIGAAQPDPDEIDTRGTARTATLAEAALPSVSSAGPPGTQSLAADEIDVANNEIVQRILDRFAVRHTALPARERKILAQTIVREAHALRLEPELVMAVIEVESAGYHLAQSHVGALGLMQILPATGKELAGKLGIEWMGDHTLFDPIINVRLGTAYLRELADRYDGNVEIALAAYNWGPGRIDRRLRRGATVPSGYIQQVMRAVDRYADTGPTRS